MRVHETTLEQPMQGQAFRFKFTNDHAIHERYGELAALQAASKSDAAAVLVGTGGLLSLADVLPPTVYVTDNQPRILDWVAYSVEAVRQEPTIEAVLNRLGTQQSRMDIDAFLDVHFTRSDERFATVQQALRAATIHYMDMDYAQAGDVDALGGLVRRAGQAISLFNATNLHTHLQLPLAYEDKGLPEYFNALRQWPWAEPFGLMIAGPRPGYASYSLPLLGSLDAYQSEVTRWLGEP